MTAKIEIRRLDGLTERAVPAEKHPAQFSTSIVDEFERVLVEEEWPGRMILDPFGGRGRAHLLAGLGHGWKTTTVEIEPRWTASSTWIFDQSGDGSTSFCGDSTALPARWTGRFGAAVSSPCYGNRMSDSHKATDPCSVCKGSGVARGSGGALCGKCGGSGLSPRRSYTHDLGEKLVDGNAGSLYFWQDEYRELHRDVWAETFRVLRHGGLFLLNVKDFDRTERRGGDPVRQRVCAWHLRTCRALGFVREQTITIPHPGMRFGANRHRAPNEVVYVLRKP